MESNKEEALKSKEIAEKRFYERDFAGAKNYALKAKTLYPGLDGISQLVATFEVYIASEVRFNGEVDYYSVLGLKQFAEKDAVKKQYKKMAVLLHPDKNKSVGAEGAFKLLSEAWTVLSDNAKRKSYDHRNRQHLNQSSASPQAAARLDTFWTVCTACKVQYEYLRKYVNKRLSCKNCRGVFIAVETGNAPVNGSFPYTPWPYATPPPPPPPPPSSNGYGIHGGYDGVSYVPSNSTSAFFPGNGVSGYHTSGHGHGYEYVSNVSFQWSTSSTAGVVGPTGNQGHGNVKVKPRVNGKRSVANAIPPPPPPPPAKPTRPDKRRKVFPGPELRNGHLDAEPNPAPETKPENGNASAFEILARRYSAAPAFDARKLLIDKARAAILRKLGEIKLSESKLEPEAKKAKPEPEYPVNGGQPAKPEIVPAHSVAHGPKTPVSITVPDPDFHDFDNDRSEECFKPKQIWALYDEEDGMPRLYCLIREVISVKPFKILITYLNSKTDTEFGAVNWLYHGFTKSCGNFRAWTSDVVDQVNVFSHLLGREKAGRGGCVRLYPRAGDVWAVYRNWSPEWDRATPEETRHQYEMVEVLDEYHEDLGVGVAPLVKIPGFKTVYGRSSGEAPAAAVRWIPRREMVRFSHQVPSWLLGPEQTGLPEKCWDLDPAATPDDLLHCPVAGDAALGS